MPILTSGEIIARHVSCLSELYARGQLSFPPSCRGCNWSKICRKMSLVIKKAQLKRTELKINDDGSTKFFLRGSETIPHDGVGHAMLQEKETYRED